MTDNAKELLALADEIEACDYLITPGRENMKLMVHALRLSARQQASVEELARSIAFQEWPLASADECDRWVETQWMGYALEARALLAKYDIFEKVEG